MQRRKNQNLNVSKAGNYYRRIRLNDGRFITVQLTSSNPDDIDNASPNEIWHTADGRKLLPKDMEFGHLLNVRKLLEERGRMAMQYHKVSINDIMPDAFTMQLYPIYEHVCNECAYRLGTKQRPPNQSAPVERPRRKFDFEL